MKKAYIAPSIYMMNATTESTLMVQSIVIDASKSGDDALVGSEGEWDIWGEEEE